MTIIEQLQALAASIGQGKPSDPSQLPLIVRALSVVLQLFHEAALLWNQAEHLANELLVSSQGFVAEHGRLPSLFAYEDQSGNLWSIKVAIEDGRPLVAGYAADLNSAAVYLSSLLAYSARQNEYIQSFKSQLGQTSHGD